jgi:hypothetical protein
MASSFFLPFPDILLLLGNLVLDPEVEKEQLALTSHHLVSLS